jgi:PAS domain S-box-containing protein
LTNLKLTGLKSTFTHDFAKTTRHNYVGRLLEAQYNKEIDKMNEQIAILLIEDNSADARLIQEAMLETARDHQTTTRFKLTVVDRLSAGLGVLAQGNVDVILLDLSLPDSEGLSTLLSISIQAPTLPIIVMTGLDDETVTVGALQAGAQDYLIKGELDSNMLVRAIRYAIERKRAEEATRASEERYRDLFDLVPIAVYTCDPNGLIQEYNHRAVELWGREPQKNNPEEKYCGSFKMYYTDGRFMPHEECPMCRILHSEALEPHELEVLIERPDGSRRNVVVHPLPIKNERGDIVEVLNCLYDITERKKAEEALRENEKQLQALNEILEQKVEEQTGEVRKLASELTLAEQRERHRISHILHDDLQQRLYAIQMQMELLGDGHKIENTLGQRELAEIKEQIHEVLALTRHLSIDLSPPILRDEGLTQAIGWLASHMQEQHGLRIELRADETFAIPDEEIQVLLFNCVRELLFNVVKHAGVDHAVVSLQRSNADLRIEVHDKGNGFNMAMPAWQEGNDGTPQQRSFGLPTLRHRLTLFGGSMDIKSEPGAGTQVTLVVPVYREPSTAGEPMGK